MIRNLIIALLLVGCGGKVNPAKEQDQSQLALPEFEGKGKAPFALTDEQSELMYKANLLFWEDTVTPAQVQRVSNASVNGRLVRAKFLKFLKEDKAPVVKEIKEREAEAAAIDKQVVQSRKDNFDDIVELQKPLLVDWFPNRLASLKDGGLISEGDVAAANAQFQVYCQAKIWETAVNSLLKISYPARPTPLIMCEAYYAEAKLLDKTTEACQDATAGQTKDYVDCFWKEGVLKTAMFAARSEIPCTARAGAPKKNDQIKAWVESGTLQAALRTDFAANQGFALTNFGAAVVEGDKNVDNTYAFASTCASAFKAKEMLNVNQRPRLALNIVEVTESTLKSYPTNFELLIPSPSRTDKDIVDRYRLLGNDLMTFAARPGGPSVNDRIFNNDAAKAVREAEDIRAQYDAAPGFAAVRQVETDYVPASLKEKKAANIKRLAELDHVVKRSVDGLDARETDLTNELIKVLGEGAAASMEDGVSKLFVGFMLKLTKVEDRIEVRVQIRNGRGAIGCVTLTGSPCDAVRTEREAAWSDLQAVTFNGDKNSLAFEMPLDDPEAQGLVFEPEGTKHNLIPTEELVARTLRLSAYSNRLHDLLDFFTGKAELVENGQVQREGSISGDAYGSNAAAWE